MGFSVGFIICGMFRYINGTGMIRHDGLCSQKWMLLWRDRGTVKCHVRAVGTSLHCDRLFIRKVELLPNQNPQNVCVWLTQLLRAGCEGLLVLLRQEDQQGFFFFYFRLCGG